jgi:hypothetical protein
MKRFFSRLVGAFFLLPLVIPAPTLALSDASMPQKFGIFWGASAGAAYIRSIPTTSQIGVQNCAASLPDGFPPLTFVPAAGGGCPPWGADFNGILRQITQWNQWQAAGGPIFYDAAFATSIGGYPARAMLSSTVTLGTRWISTVDNNTTNPDAGGAGWIQDPSQIPIGTPVQSLNTTGVGPGYVSANGLTIGNAASNATNRANADTQFLFSFVWLICTNAACPIYTSAGSASTRGVSAAADFAANKALAVPNMNGAALMGADSQGGTTSTNLVNVPVTSGSRTVPGSVLGENLHSLTSAENGAHTHANTLSDPGHSHGVTGGIIGGTGGTFVAQSGGGGSVPLGALGITISTAVTGLVINNASSGSGTAHNTVPRSFIIYWNLKL